MRNELFCVCRDEKSGIAWIEDHKTGLSHSRHPSIDESGSVSGMKARGYWSKEAEVVKANGYFFNTSVIVKDEDAVYDQILAITCNCAGCRTRMKV